MIPLSVLGAVAVLAAALWATGGLKETPKQPAQSAGKPLDLGLFTVTVRDVRIGLADARFGSAQERFLIMRMRVVNKGKETESLENSGLADGVVARTKTGKWVEPERIEGVAAGAETNVVQPGLPVEASAMWKMGPADSPEKLTVGLREWKYEQGFTDSDFNWLVQKEDDKLVGRLVLPVAPMSAAPQPSPRATWPQAGRPTTTAWPTATARPTTTARPRPTAGSPRPTASRP